MSPGVLTAERAEALVGELDRRGVALISSWEPGRRKESLEEALPVARAQKKRGLPVSINANACLYSLFNGDPATAHIDAAGKPFWDTSFEGKKDMGCPFTLEERRKEIRERISFFIEAYHRQGLPVDFLFADWEIDGPLEWNGAWESSRKCRRCREQLPGLDDFAVFQKAMREMRGRLQKEIFSDPVRARYPGALVGNYAVYPHDGTRYWFDYFENRGESPATVKDRKAPYRRWAREFEFTGYTMAMPVLYPWSWTWDWYDFPVPDYRWFYNLLLEASSAGKSTPPGMPLIPFVHWHLTVPPTPPDPRIVSIRSEAYQELLWHALLRGADSFFLWCLPEENEEEIRLVHTVWAEAQQYGEFLDKGIPVVFDVPGQPGTVLSALQLDRRVLVRRTDFLSSRAPAELNLGGKKISIASDPGRCRIYSLDSAGDRTR